VWECVDELLLKKHGTGLRGALEFIVKDGKICIDSRVRQRPEGEEESGGV
jgi:hypothetical protein